MRLVPIRVLLAMLCCVLAPAAGAADPVWSVQIGIGGTRFDASERGIEREFPGLQPGFELRESTTALRLAGSYHFDPYLALDFDLVELGDLIASDADGRRRLFSVTAVATSVRLHRRWTERLDAYVRVGAFMWTSSVSFDDTVDEGLEVTVGVGLDVNVYGDRERLLRLQWDRYNFNGVVLDQADVLSANLVFNFW